MSHHPALRTPPRHLPAVGCVLHLNSGDIRYRTAGAAIRVDRVRTDISDWYDGDWVWVEGAELDPRGHPTVWIQALVRVDAIPHRAGPLP